VDYADPIYEDYRPGKMNKCIMEIENGWVLSGYAKHPLTEIGNVEAILSRAKEVRGRTYDIREKIKERGFVWDKENKCWMRRG